jgi:hypothetical protein
VQRYTKVGLALFTHVILQSKNKKHMMIASIVHVTNLPHPGVNNPNPRDEEAYMAKLAVLAAEEEAKLRVEMAALVALEAAGPSAWGEGGEGDGGLVAEDGVVAGASDAVGAKVEEEAPAAEGEGAAAASEDATPPPP